MRTIRIDSARLESALDDSEPLVSLGALTIGVFDGLHVGHRSLVETMKRESSGSPVGLMTFSEHPQAILSGRAPVRLVQPELRDRILAEWGVEALIELETDRELLGMAPEEFVGAILRLFRIGTIVVGADFAFGRNRSGDASTFRRIGRPRVVVVSPLKAGGRVASATAVREALAEARFGEAAEMLGREYSTIGTIVTGDGRGAAIGYPTLNLEPAPEALPDGIYAARTGEGDAVVHLGARPTFGAPERRFEVHLLDEVPTLGPGDTLEVTFVKRLRDVVRCDSLAELQAMIRGDIAEARSALLPQDR